MGLLFFVFVALPVAQGLYFHIAETERKCFIEEIPDETMVIGNYKLQLYDPRTNGFAPSSPEIGMHVEIRDPEDKIILSKVYSSEGRWTFTSHTPGEHVICLYSNSTKWFSGTQLRVHLDIQVGEHAIDYANVAQKEKLSELQLRYRQEKFRKTSDKTNYISLLWPVFQIIIVTLVGAWNITHLKSFFKAKKIL